MADWMLVLWRWIAGGEAAGSGTSGGQGEPDPSLNLGGIMIDDG